MHRALPRCPRGPRAAVLLAAVLSVVAPTIAAHATHLPVEAPRRTYGKGLPDGRVFGFSDGYLDGFQLAYRRSFNNRVPNRVRLVVYPDRAPVQPERPRYLTIYREMPQVVPGSRYIEGYREGYAEAYDRGYGAGRRDGRSADRSDLATARAKLACREARTRC